MQYTRVNQFSITSTAKPLETIIIATQDTPLGRIFARHLETDFKTVIVAYQEVLGSIRMHEPKALLIDTGPGLNSIPVIKSVMRTFPSLFVVTTGPGVTDDLLDVLMRLGVSRHVSREFGRPQDIVSVIRETMYI